MGRNKSLIEFHGTTQKDFAFQLLDRYCEKVYTSVNKEVLPSDFKNPIVDQFSFGGPLNGILSALEFQQDVAWLTMPVDMPLVNESTVNLLLKNRDKTKMATCFQHGSDGQLEPLLTIWEPNARKPLLKFVQNEGRSPIDYLRTADVHCVGVEDSSILKSVNTQEDLEAILLRYRTNRSKK